MDTRDGLIASIAIVTLTSFFASSFKPQPSIAEVLEYNKEDMKEEPTPYAFNPDFPYRYTGLPIPRAHAAASEPPTAHAVAPGNTYKETRLREMDAMWKGTVLQNRTVPLLAMLLVENGALNESVRGDSGYAIGLEQNHICIRGFTAPEFPTKHYCGAGAEARLAKDLKGTPWHDYLTSWQTQFRHYTLTVEGMTKDGYSVDSIIQSWNSREIGRRDKVRRHESYVQAALDIL